MKVNRVEDREITKVVSDNEFKSVRTVEYWIEVESEMEEKVLLEFIKQWL